MGTPWWGNGAGPGGLSAESYIERHLRLADAEHYSAAGIVPYRKAEDDGIEILLAWEKPWNALTQAYDPLSWNIFGGKRIPRQERKADATAVRCFTQSVGDAAGESAGAESLYEMIPNSFALWYATGKFAILFVEFTGGAFADLPELFAASRAKAGPPQEYQINPLGMKTWVKQIEAVEWVPSSSLVPEPKKLLSNLVSNLLRVPNVREFLEGKLDPDEAYPKCPPPAAPPAPAEKGEKGKGGKGKGKGKWNSAKGWNSRLKGYGKGGKGFKGMKGMDAWGSMGMMPMGPMGMAPMGMYPMGKGMMPTGKGGPMMPPMGQEPSDMHMQMYGEQLFVLVQPLVPSTTVAQKITGMLMELPQNELILNLTHPEELQKRVKEALDLLQKDGVL